MTTQTRKPITRTATIQTIGTVRVLWITRDKLTLAYRLETIASDLGGIAFQLEKAHQVGNDMPEVYHVLLNGHNTSCTCAGHSFRGKCKHTDALEALIRAGKIEVPARQVNPVCFECRKPYAECSCTI